MKDAQGHGSDAHQTGVRQATGRYRVQTLALHNVGRPWQTAKTYGNRTVAETVAKGMRTDGGFMRVRPK